MARPTLATNRKFVRLCRALRSKALARGSLELLWEAAYASGDEVLGDVVDVEGIADWQGEPGALAAALVDAGGPGSAGFLEINGAGLYVVHDLWDHAPRYVRARAERESERRSSGRTIREIRAEAGRASANKRSTNERSFVGQTQQVGSKWAANGQQMAALPAPSTQHGSSTTSESVLLPSVSLLPPLVSTAPALPGGDTTRAEPRKSRSKESEPLPDIPPELDTPEFRAAWSKRLAERAARGSRGRLVHSQVQAQFAKLSRVASQHGIKIAVECVEYATESGSQGVVFADRVERLAAARSGSGRANGHAAAPRIVNGVDRRTLGEPAAVDPEFRRAMLMIEAGTLSCKGELGAVDCPCPECGRSRIIAGTMAGLLESPPPCGYCTGTLQAREAAGAP